MKGQTLTELNRLLRHLLPPALAFAVGKGWLPANLQQPLMEAVIAGSAVVAALIASRARDITVKKEK